MRSSAGRFTTLGLAALIGLMAMAAFSATPAMAEATSLCSKDSKECPKGSSVSHVHETSVGKAKLLSSLINVECDVLFLGEVGEPGAPLLIEGNFTYTNCEKGCTVTEENGPAEIEVLKEGHETANVTGEGLVHVSCSSFISCNYNFVGLVGVGKGPLLASQTNGEVSISGQTLNKEGGFLCPKTAKLDITTTPLSATYLAEGNEVEGEGAGELTYLKSEWMIEGETLTELEVKEEEISLTGGPLTLTAPSKGITIECQKAEGTGKIFKGGSDEATISLTECKVLELPSCEVSGTVKVEVKSKLFRTTNGFYRKLEPLTEGKPITTISFKEGTGCSLAPKKEVTGNVAAEFSQEELTSQPTTLSEEISNTVNKELKEAKVSELKLALGESTAFLDGELDAELSGANAEGEFHQAVATKLCEQPPVAGACALNKEWKAETEVSMVNDVEMKFEIGIATFQCGYSVLGGPTSTDVGDPALRGGLGTAAFTECNEECSVMVRELPYGYFFEVRPNAGNGGFTLRNPKFEFECGEEEICIYSARSLFFELVIGGNPAMLSSPPLTMTKQNGSAAGCQMNAVWRGVVPMFGTIKYKFESPQPLYVTI